MPLHDNMVLYFANSIDITPAAVYTSRRPHQSGRTMHVRPGDNTNRVRRGCRFRANICLTHFLPSRLTPWLGIPEHDSFSIRQQPLNCPELLPMILLPFCRRTHLRMRCTKSLFESLADFALSCLGYNTTTPLTSANNYHKTIDSYALYPCFYSQHQ
jgi:hypothetical protein